MKGAVISGGAGGLGRAFESALRQKGWQVALIDLPGAPLEKLRDEQIDSRHLFACDISDSSALAATCEDIRNTLPSIDLVIYNAGITQIGPFESTDAESRRRLFNINTIAAMEMAQEFLLPLRTSKGTHLAMSSVAGFAPLKHRSAYAASKHALQGFFSTLRVEERPYGVSVTVAAPSFVATNPGAMPDANQLLPPGAAEDAKDQMSAYDAVDAILKAVKKQRAFVPVGRVAWLAWILNRVSPSGYARLMDKNTG